MRTFIACSATSPRAPETNGASLESHQPFLFLLPLRPERRGKIYALRTYRVRPGGLSPTLRGREVALRGARPYGDHPFDQHVRYRWAPQITSI